MRSQAFRPLSEILFWALTNRLYAKESAAFGPELCTYHLYKPVELVKSAEVQICSDATFTTNIDGAIRLGFSIHLKQEIILAAESAALLPERQIRLSASSGSRLG